MKLSMSSEMGIHALWFLASQGDQGPTLCSQIAQGIGVSEAYLIKVLRRLVDARLVSSKKGRKGGYRLRLDADSISLADVVCACDSQGGIYACADVERSCGKATDCCPVHAAMARAEAALLDELGRTSIGDLVRHTWPTPDPAEKGD